MMHWFSIGPQPGQAGPVMDSLWAWHDAADAATLTQESGGRVIGWGDKSGNGRSVTQGTGSIQRPYYGSRFLNGLNALDFQGSNCLDFAAGQYLGIGNSTAIMVYQADVMAHGYLLSGRVGSRSYAYEMAVNTASNGIFRVNHANANNFTLWSGDDGLAPHIAALRREGGIVGAYLDSDLKATASAANISLQGNMCYGLRHDGFSPSFFFDGLIAEALIYDKALTPEEMTQNLDYLQDKWGM